MAALRDNFYMQQANHCDAIAQQHCADPAMKTIWLQLANEWLTLELNDLALPLELDQVSL